MAQHSGDDFGRAADAMSAADLARIYPARRVMVPGTEAMSRKRLHGSSAAASPHATEVPDQGDGLTDTAAQLAAHAAIAGRCLRGRERGCGPRDERSRSRRLARHDRGGGLGHGDR